MKEKITAFINDLISYDYILFGASFVLFILFIILAIIVRKKVGLSLFLVLLSFAMLFVAPSVGYVKMHAYLFKNSTTLTLQQELVFTQAVVVKGTLTNESNFNFKSCRITANAYKVSGNPVKDFIFPYNPFQKMQIVEEDIKKGEVRNFKIIIEPFTYSSDYNISIGANCK
jgi:hypothetical protein